MNEKLHDAQGAYRKGRSTADHIFSLYAIIHKYLRKQGGRFYIAFIDFSRAFDSIPHSILWFRLMNKGIHGKILTVLRSMYSQLRSCVKTPEGITEFFNCTVGTRQGCMVSPFLFALYIDELVTKCQNMNCPSIYIDNDFPDAHMLMYADDICIVNDTVGRLQKQLNVLSQFCAENGLKVNLSKSNVVVFRNGGHLRNNERFYFNEQQIECINQYKYLGIIFSSRLTWSLALKNLASQAEKAVFQLKRFLNTCGGLPIKLSLDLFDKLVVPILLYGSELWGTIERDSIEIVHRKFCKYILSVSYNTSNGAALGELGRVPLSVQYKLRCVKFWLKIVHDDGKKIRNSLYRMLAQYEASDGINWASEIKQLLYTHGFGEVWFNQGVGNVDLFLCTFKQRLIDMSNQNWHNDVLNNSKLDVYRKHKHLLDFEVYLSSDIYWKHKVALSRFRCANHKLAIERYRYTKCDRCDRICKYCKEQGVDVIEDEIHFLLVCPMLESLRKKYLLKHIAEHLTATENFVKLLSSKKSQCLTDLAAFVYHALILYIETNDL